MARYSLAQQRPLLIFCVICFGLLYGIQMIVRLKPWERLRQRYIPGFTRDSISMNSSREPPSGSGQQIEFRRSHLFGTPPSLSMQAE